MSLARTISVRPLWALDPGADGVRAVVAEKKRGEFRALGGGEAPWPRMESGRPRRIFEAAEAVTAAIRAAERSSGLSAETLYYNFDDDSLKERTCQGTRLLGGDGQIRQADVEEACRAAKRGAGDLSSRLVYSRTSGYLVDERDAVEDPIGIYGRKLDVSVYLLFADAASCEWWQKAVERSPARRSVRVISAWSSAYGVIPAADRGPKRLIVDAGADVCTVSVFGSGRLLRTSAFRSAGAVPPDLFGRLAAWARVAANEESGIRETLLCGEWAGDASAAAAFEAVGLEAHHCAPYGIRGLEKPGDAALAGLLRVADELEAGKPTLRPEGGSVSRIKEKVTSFLNEYF